MSSLRYINSNFLFAIFFSSGCPAFQHGYHTGIINNPHNVIKDWIRDVSFNRTKIVPDEHYVTIMISLVIAIYSIGGVIGSLMTTLFTSSCGRKCGILINSALTMVSIVFLSISKVSRSYEMLIMGRFLIGINCGLSGCLCPMYLIEISPTSIRGTIASIYQLFLVISILLANVTTVRQTLGTEDLWPWAFAISGIPCVLQIFFFLFCPESPRYLYNTMKDEYEAEEALAWFRNTWDVSEELEEIKAEGEVLREVPHVTVELMFKNDSLREIVLLCILIMISQQWSGINCLVYFSSYILQDMEFSQDFSAYGTLFMNIVNLLGTFLGIAIIDIVGRRILLMTSYAVLTLDSLVLGLSLSHWESWPGIKEVALGSVFVFIAAFSVGLGPVPWLIVPEIFPYKTRALALALTTPFNWFANFVVGQVFLLLTDDSSYYVFFAFMVLDIVCLYFVWMYLPEMKKKTPADIVRMYNFADEEDYDDIYEYF